MKKVILTFLCSIIPMMLSAQIGYQVSLLNNATGEPRSNESVSVKVKITDSNGNVICEETKKATSNDFGVVSLSVGNSETFANADWANLPFFIEASVDSRLLGRSQILSVPVAEHAKHTGVLTKEILCSKKWECIKYDTIMTATFFDNGTARCTYGYLHTDEDYDIYNGTYLIDGNVVVFMTNNNDCWYFHYFAEENILSEANFGDIYR